MHDPFTVENDFLQEINTIVEKNMANEQFGVAELAEEMHMSRSNLLRKVKSLTRLSVSQLISQVRLRHGMELLRTSSLNVSEISLEVGFGSTSYFIKCFREHYGYPPGEVGKREAEINDAGETGLSEISETRNPVKAEPLGNNNKPGVEAENAPFEVPGRLKTKQRFIVLAASLGLLIVFTIGMFVYFKKTAGLASKRDKSIAVLPFKNESNDTTNVYLINGLMEATLTNLQKIGDLKVISRTSVEHYRNLYKSIPEMGRELNVNYFVEGSGQKIGDQILLNIQLIEASGDRHLWAKQYRRQAKDIFALQQEIAENIAEEIQAIITPDEKKRIEKNPAKDLVAYDFYLKGRDLFYKGKGSRKNLEDALVYFKKAIARENEFALAYADAAMICYYLDIFHTDKKYAAELSSYADKAFLYDSKSGESMVAKALAYMYGKQYDLALPYLEKALEYNPNSGIVLRFLSEFYNTHVPNTAKYLEYALKGSRVDIAPDSATASFNYLNLSNALMQAGFIEEASMYVNKSLEYNPGNPFAAFLKIFILFAKHKNIEETRNLLISEFDKDTTRFYILPELGKACYIMKDYASAYLYYKKFTDAKERQQLDIFKHEDLRIAIAFAKTDHKKQAEAFAKSFRDFAENDRTIYRSFNLAAYYAYQDNKEKAIQQLALFSKENNFQYWVLLLDKDPVAESIRDLPGFKEIMKTMDARFWDTHKKIRATLEEEGLL